ncbi:hypothetical protein ACVIJW_010638 [Bradyrhizobium barranii subsp. barranii]
MGILVVAGEARLGLVESELREQSDAVEGLLTVGDHVVAERLDLQPREGLVDAFDLLQADDVRLALLQPGQQQVDPLPDRVHVPGSNSDGHWWGSGQGPWLEQTANAPVKDAAKSPTKLTRLKPGSGH